MRRQPERSCIACRTTQSKHQLIRIVRTSSGNVELDPTGKLSGRGAYLCRKTDCWNKGLHGAALEHHLHLPERLPADERERLLQEGLALVGDDTYDNAMRGR